MTYTLSPTSKPGFPTVTRDDGLSAVFTDAIKDEATKYILARVPTEFGVGWIIVGECEGEFSPSALLTALEHGFINVPSEAWA